MYWTLLAAFPPAADRSLAGNMAIESKAEVALDSLSPEEAEQFVRAFGFKSEEPPVRLYGGYASSNFKVIAKKDGEGTSRPFLLKVNYGGLNIEDIEHQLFVMNHLRTCSFPTNYPHPSSSGSLMVEQNGRSAILLDFIHGKSGDKVLAEKEDKAPAILRELAATLARLHQVNWPEERTVRDIRSGYPLCNTGDLLRGEDTKLLGHSTLCCRLMRALRLVSKPVAQSPIRAMASANIPTWDRHYVNGQWTSSTGKCSDVIDSNTGQVCARVAMGGAAEVDAAVAAARAAFPAWAEKPLDERKAVLQKVLERWQEKKAAATEWLIKELGCNVNFASKVQVNMVDMHLGSCLKMVDLIKFEEKMSLGSLVIKEPIGVVGCITPWNYPLNQIACKVFPAMLVGCTVVVKPSEVTPVVAYILSEAIHEAGVPPGVYNMVMGDGPNCGEVIAAHPDVDLVSFTGSTRAGRRISEVAAKTLKGVRTELGGKSAALLLEDADFKKLVPKFVMQVMSNSGQSCNALSRMLVPTSRRAEAIELAKKVVEGVKVGKSADSKASIGPLASQAQWERVQGYIQTGIKEGANLVAGGPGRPEGLEEGFFVKPTIFADVDNKMTIAQEEIFGPVLSIIPYESEEEAIRIANDTVYGLNNAVGSASEERAMQVARKLRSGMVMINDTTILPDAPFGGYKQSGNAREWGTMGIEEYLVTKTMAGKPKSNL
eukprot:s3567_g8.t1